MVVTTTAAKRLWRHVFRRLRGLTSGADRRRPRRRRRVLFAAACGRLVRSVGQGRSPCRRWENSRRRRRWPLTVRRRLPSAARLAAEGALVVGCRRGGYPRARGRSRGLEGSPPRPAAALADRLAAPRWPRWPRLRARSQMAVRRPGAGGLSAGGRRWFQSRRDRRLRPVDELVEKGPATHVFPVRKGVRTRGLSEGSSVCSRQPGRDPWVRREKRVSPEGVAVGDVGAVRWVRVSAPGGVRRWPRVRPRRGIELNRRGRPLVVSSRKRALRASRSVRLRGRVVMTRFESRV